MHRVKQAIGNRSLNHETDDGSRTLNPETDDGPTKQKKTAAYTKRTANLKAEIIRGRATPPPPALGDY
jgi:hypothetical protein